MNSATSNAVIRRLGSPLFADALFAGGCVASAVCANSVYVVFFIGTSAHWRRRPRVLEPGSRIDEPSRDGATEDDRPEAVDSRGGLGRRDSSARVKRPLESHAGGRCRCVADVRDASYPPLLVRCDLSWEKSHATA